ncbi:MAG: fluoride efflux transporter CrcB [Steroidobacteraceae bacterium]
MKAVLVVALGGALGSVARFKLSGWVLHQAVNWRFPIGTFVVNVAGCLIAGVLAGMSTKHHAFSPDTRLLLFTGLLGGFTTFSAFGLETALLIKRGEWGVAAANVFASVLVSLVALWLGFELAEPRS